MNDFEAELYQYVGVALRARRKTLNLTQAHLAERAGILRSSVANIEAGRQRLTLHLLYQLCAVLEIDVTTVLPPALEVARPATVTVSVNGEQQEVPPKTAEVLKQFLIAEL